MVPARPMRLSAPDQSSTSGDRMLFHQRLPLDKGRRAALVGVPDPLIPLGLERKGLIEAFGGGRRCFLFPRRRSGGAGMGNVPQRAGSIVLVDPHEFGEIDLRERGTASDFEQVLVILVGRVL